MNRKRRQLLHQELLGSNLGKGKIHTSPCSLWRCITQGRGSMENRRYSYDGTLRPDVASMFSGSRSSFDSAVIGRPSYESAYAPRVSLDSAAPRLSSEATVSFLQVTARIVTSIVLWHR